MIAKTKKFVQDVITEIKKVNWPEQENLVNSTFVVLIISAVFTVFIMVTDQLVSKLVDLLY